MSLIEIESPVEKKKPFPKILIATSIGMAIASLGLAVGALLNLGDSNSSVSELGIGVTLTPSCDNDGITMLPYESFENRVAPDHRFTFNEIQLSGISSNCAGKDFILTVRDSDGNLLPITRNSSGTTYSSIRIYFRRFVGADNSVDVNGNLTDMFTLVGGDSTTVTVQAISGLVSVKDLPVDSGGNVTWNGQNPGEYWAQSNDSNEVSIVLNPSAVAGEESLFGFADSRSVYKITLESTNHSNTI